mgnify:CR=1 FL=1
MWFHYNWHHCKQFFQLWIQKKLWISVLTMFSVYSFFRTTWLLQKTVSCWLRACVAHRKQLNNLIWSLDSLSKSKPRRATWIRVEHATWPPSPPPPPLLREVLFEQSIMLLAMLKPCTSWLIRAKGPSGASKNVKHAETHANGPKTA